MILKRLSECRLDEAVQTWNRAFGDFASQQLFTSETLLLKIRQEGLSPSMSVMAFDQNAPAGILLCGKRTANGKVRGWNGGTGVVPEARGKRIGRMMLARSMEHYREEGVEIATLEVSAENEAAIKLYESAGYRLKEVLGIFHQRGRLPFLALPYSAAIQQISVERLLLIPFYNHDSPWQTQPENIINPSAILLSSQTGQELGYALFKRIFSSDRTLLEIQLYQCNVHPEAPMPKLLAAYLLDAVFQPQLNISRSAVNVGKSSIDVVEHLHSAGFDCWLQQLELMWEIEKQ
ncbi:GNAT family N-acetyltransferase [Bacillus lacus]|uniref:GNAT family N-acetyltransferase n=1 Tax=Metabacillus lacus TaxID=1983721 RepID=A0A7X2J0P5_9BACI|nr:GNAT family N-acetyltransferase [Metabacillus lacus]MRX73181.1 GNAT family N-acetyltransferase [Metabacillus lacus]